MSQTLVLRFEDLPTLVQELDTNLARGGAFVPGAEAVAVGDLCEAVLEHPVTGAQLKLPAQVVMAQPQGAALAFLDFDNENRKALTAFVHSAASADSNSPKPLTERLRGLTLAEQLRFAREGDQRERVAIERLYGKSVWEALIRNPRLTASEAGRIARMGLLPRTLLELIVNNAAWLSSSQVRRALLSNPRLKGELLTKVLRAMPKSELRLVTKQSAYSQAAREAARRLMSTQS